MRWTVGEARGGEGREVDDPTLTNKLLHLYLLLLCVPSDVVRCCHDLWFSTDSVMEGDGVEDVDVDRQQQQGVWLNWSAGG